MLVLRNQTLDWLKVILALMVIGLHCGFLKETSALGWYLTVNGLFRIAVPTFMVINGYYFYNVVSHSKIILWFKRMLILYIGWMLFYGHWWLKVPHTFFDVVKIGYILCVGYWHLWYIIAVVQAAFLLLFLKERMSDSSLLLCGIILFLLGVIIQYVQSYNFFYFPYPLNSMPIHRNFLFFAFPFLVIGYLSAKYNITDKLKNKKKIVKNTLIICGIFLLFESYINFRLLNDIGFDQYIFLILVAPILFYNCIVQDNYFSIKYIGQLANSLYLIHVFCFHVFHGLFDVSQGTKLTFYTIGLSCFISILLIKTNEILYDKLKIRII